MLFKPRNVIWLLDAPVLIATYMAAIAFGKEQARPPTIEEKDAFAWRAFASSLYISFVLGAFAIALAASPSELALIRRALVTPSIMTTALVLFALRCVTHYLLIRWFFGRVTKPFGQAKNA